MPTVSRPEHFAKRESSAITVFIMDRRGMGAPCLRSGPVRQGRWSSGAGGLRVDKALRGVWGWESVRARLRDRVMELVGPLHS